MLAKEGGSPLTDFLEKVFSKFIALITRVSKISFSTLEVGIGVLGCYI